MLNKRTFQPCGRDHVLRVDLVWSLSLFYKTLYFSIYFWIPVWYWNMNVKFVNLCARQESRYYSLFDKLYKSKHSGRIHPSACRIIYKTISMKFGIWTSTLKVTNFGIYRLRLPKSKFKLINFHQNVHSAKKSARNIKYTSCPSFRFERSLWLVLISLTLLIV
jgi:hypothetical protein